MFAKEGQMKALRDLQLSAKTNQPFEGRRERPKRTG